MAKFHADRAFAADGFPRFFPPARWLSCYQLFFIPRGKTAFIIILRHLLRLISQGKLSTKFSLYNAAHHLKISAVPTFFAYHNWKPTFSIKLSMLVLVSAIVLTLLYPGLWVWSASVVFVNHMILTIAGLIPRSTLLGPNVTRLPDEAAQRDEVSVTIDDGPDPDVTPQVLDILDRYQAKASFFCIGTLAMLHSDLCREIIRRGHTIESHGQTHNWMFSLFDPWNIHREVRESQQTLTRITGSAPRFFRPTAGLRNPWLEPVLAHCGLHLCSWSKRGFDTRESNVDVVLARLTHNLKGGDILLLHDGNAARTKEGRPVVIEVLPRLLDHLAQSNLHSVTLRAAIP